MTLWVEGAEDEDRFLPGHVLKTCHLMKDVIVLVQ